MAAITRWVLRHRLLVMLAWLALTAAGALAAGPTTGAMTQDFGALPGRSGFATNQEILRTYGNGGASDPVVLVLTLPPGTTVDSPGVRSAWSTALARVSGDARVVSWASTGDRGFVSADGRTTFALLHPPAAPGFPPYAAALRNLNGLTVAGAPVQVTGTDALFVAASDATGPGLLAEIALAGLAALVVLVALFRSALALLPLLIAAIAILVTFLAVWGLTALTEVSFVVQFLVGLIGLGIAIDYALLVTTRWREERVAGLPDEEAVVRAMATAGGAVVFSGVTVAVSLAAMIVLPVPFLRAMGFGGLLVPLLAVLVSITLLPVLLATVGPRLSPRPAGRPPARRGGTDRWWTWWARLVTRRPLISALAAGIVLVALIVPAFSIRLGAPAPASMASSGPARAALDTLTASGIGPGVLSPAYVLADATEAGQIAATAARRPGIRAAVAPTDWSRDGTRLVVVLADHPASYVGLPFARVGGTTAQGRDFVDAVYGNAPVVLILIVVVTLVLLIRAFRSVLLAVKAVLLNVLSVGATYGLLVLTWQDGRLSERVWGIDATGALTEWVPVLVFAFLFGLSMDYEVFILARIREEYDRLGSTIEATVVGLARTGRLVTGAALILFLAFASLAGTPGTEVKIFATALGLGILLDATVIRAILVPALVVLFDRANWWLPRRLGPRRPTPPPCRPSPPLPSTGGSP
ncbi:MMPL family transporter [Actinoplanes sp. NPDC089786]|uniref:MMPL family transporter n=1 Tax=Actinoplanes sp. NPDC089786 TaxID=3155185 RepID=UPI0034249CEB